MSALNGLQRLEYLDISNNKIQNLHVGMFDDLLNLNTIMAGNNPITSLQLGLFKNNKKLRVINFYRSKIKHIDAEFEKELPTGASVTLNKNQCVFPSKNLEYSIGSKEHEEFIDIIANHCTLN